MNFVPVVGLIFVDELVLVLGIGTGFVVRLEIDRLIVIERVVGWNQHRMGREERPLEVKIGLMEMDLE